ncbi:hypothetical protein F4802DRAFT_87515 [Xylaria palmicola]|nr:hypothetical protein F4802DRAFT_87515 [Xylaria palmicola]
MATQKSAVRGALTTSKQTALTSAPPTAVAPEAGAGAGESTPYAQALARLEPLQPVLAGIAHRNRNQHRRAAWWRSFGMLRRHCARLVGELVVAAATAAAAARRSAARAARAEKSKRRRREKEKLVAAGVDAETDVVVARHAVWLRDILIPVCYLAFSQLTADNQFAPLGMVLMGILAQVQAACDCAAAPPSPPPPAAREALVAAEPTTTASDGRRGPVIPAETGRAASAPELTMGEDHHEGGQVLPRREETVGGGGGRTISREAVERSAQQPKKSKDASETRVKPDVLQPTSGAVDRAKTSSPAARGTVSATSSGKRQQVPSPHDDDNGDEVARPAKKMKPAAPAPREREEGKDKGSSADSDKKQKKKQKKNKAKKGDEFDDLFKGLF